MEVCDAEEIYRRPEHPYTKGLLSSIPVASPKLARQKKTVGIEGDIPSPIDPPPGCRFHTRCPYATGVCREAEPLLKEIAPGHMVACHLFD